MSPRTRLMLIAAVAAGLFAATLTYVPEGGLAVRVTILSKGSGTLLEPGFHFRIPLLHKISRFSGRPLRVSGTAEFSSREGVPLTLPFEIIGRIDPGRLDLLRGRDPELAARTRMVESVQRGMTVAGRFLGTADLLLRGIDRDLMDRLLASLTEEGILDPDLSFDPVVPATSGPIAGVPEIRRESGTVPTGVRVLLIGLDGADWEVIIPLIERGRLPHLARFLRQGVGADLHSFEPLLSPLLWTTVATGVSPDLHGIVDFLVADPETGQPVPIPATFRKTKALWNLFTDFGRDTSFIGWWATWPAEPISGTLVSDRMAYSLFETSGGGAAMARVVFPPERLASFLPLVVEAESIGYDEVRRFVEVSRSRFRQAQESLRGPAGSTYRDRVGHLIKILASTRTYHRIALEVLAAGQADLFGVFYQGIDEVSHRFAHFMPPKRQEVTDEEFRNYRRAVEEFYIFQDQLVGELLRAVAPDTFVVILSDHGFLTGERRPRGISADIEGTPDRWHRDRGILMMKGGPLRSGIGGTIPGREYRSTGPIQNRTVYDIAPTVLYVAGIPLSGDFSGRPIFEALAPAFLRRTPLFLVDSYQRPQAPRAPAPIPWSGDEEMVARLRSLGYLGSSPNDAGGESSGPGGVGTTFHANLAYSRMSSGDLAGAIAEVERALALQPDYLPALVIKAQALDQTGDHPGALRVARTILAEGTRQGQRQPGTFLMVARLHQTLGSVADGIEELSGWARTVGEDPELLIAIGDLLLEDGDPLAAEEHFRRALAADPAGEEGLRKVFLLLLGQARLEEAERLLAGPGSRFAGSILFHNLQGLLSQERSDYSAAEREFQAARAIDPQDVPTLSNLGALFGRTGRLPEAAQVLRRAVELEPEHPEALVNLAGALGRLGQLDELIYRLEGARTAGVDSTAIRNALGLAYYQTRDWNRAERLFRESLADDPDQPEISKILARMPDDRGRSAGETRP